MKTCKTFRTPFLQLELSSIIRFYAISDIFRFLLLLGPMLSLFFGCTNLHPMRPVQVIGTTTNNKTAPDYVLYQGNRTFLSETEERMLGNVEIKCQKGYRDYLPLIWGTAKPTLSINMKALTLQGIAMVLPVFSAVCFLMFHKKDRVSSFLALMHFVFEILSVILSLYGAFFITDRRLCFLANFSTSVSIPVLLWFLNITYALFYKTGILLSLDVYIRNFWKTTTRARSSSYHPPTPYDELKAYLIELKSLGVTPRVKIEIPEDPHRRNWGFVDATVKRILQEIRLQIAELHRDDPLVHDLLKSGKLQNQAHHGRRNSRRGNSVTSVGTMGGNLSVLHIAKMMSSKNAEYKLLKNHQHHHHHHSTRASAESVGKDDVDVILPEPDLRFDSEYTNN